MSEETWSAVDSYLTELLLAPDPALESVLQASADAGLPAIQVSPLQGKLLWLLARAQRATRILEVGTLGGYSTIWMARALPTGGHLVTLELDPTYAEVARANLSAAGLGEMVEVRLGPATDTLAQLVADGGEPFDLVFIDADKAGIPEYFRLAHRLSRPGTGHPHRQRGAQGRRARRRQLRSRRAGRAPVQRAGGRHPGGQRHDHPDSRRQGTRRPRSRSGHRPAVTLLAVLA